MQDWPISIFIGRIVLGAILLVSAATQAAPLQPSSQWQVDDSDGVCAGRRVHSKQMLTIMPSPLGQWGRILVEGPGRVPTIRQYRSVIDVGDQGDPIRTTSMVYPLSTRGQRGIMTVISSSDLDRLFHGNRFTIRSSRGNDQRVIWENREIDYASASFAMSDGVVLRSALEACTTRIKKMWGIVDGKLPEPAVASIELSDLPALFTSDDYPGEALSNSQGGTTSYALLIDEQGKVLDCSISSSSGIASLDLMGCTIFTGRAKFSPGRNSSGEAIRTIYMTPPISWRISREGLSQFPLEADEIPGSRPR